MRIADEIGAGGGAGLGGYEATAGKRGERTERNSTPLGWGVLLVLAVVVGSAEVTADAD